MTVISIDLLINDYLVNEFTIKVTFDVNQYTIPIARYFLGYLVKMAAFCAMFNLPRLFFWTKLYREIF